ncbi:hypothetical protein ACFXTI_041449 [Malus domestica]
MTITCIRRALKFSKNQESLLRSSFINCSSSRIKPQRPLWIDNINESAHPLFIKPKPRRPLKKASTALEESVHRSSFINCSSSRIKPQRPLWIDNINESAHPLFIKPKPRRPLKKAFIVHRSSTVHPQGSSPNGSLKIRSIVLLRSSPDGPLDQQSSTFKPKPQRPIEESVHRSSFINCSSSRIKPQRPLWIDNINESAHPLFIKPKPRRPLKKAFIVHRSSTVHPQDQAPTAP